MSNLEIKAREMLERTGESLAPAELILDDSNKVSFPGYPYKFEALGKKIIVSIDIFKSGYECRTCKGKKRIESKCSCEANAHPGMRYGPEELKTIEENLGEEIARNRAAMPCNECGGDYVLMRKTETCSACKGLGAVLVLPETSKNLPTSGVVISIGKQVNKDKISYKIGDRVLFGPYSGSMVPTKAGLLFKILDWNACWAKVEGAEDLSAFDFVLSEGD